MTSFDTIRCSTAALPATATATADSWDAVGVVLVAVAALWVEKLSCAGLICWYGLVAECVEPLEDPHCNIRYEENTSKIHSPLQKAQ